MYTSIQYYKGLLVNAHPAARWINPQYISHIEYPQDADMWKETGESKRRVPKVANIKMTNGESILVTNETEARRIYNMFL